MYKKLSFVIAVLVIATMLLVACQPAPPPTEAPPEEEAAPTKAAAEPTAAPEMEAIKVCQVTDVGGIDDKTFNQTAWKGVQDAMEKLGVEGKFLESQQQTDYEKNINTFIEEECDLIVPVGFLLGDATQKAAEANPDQNFAIVDYAYDPVLPNVLGLTFSVDQPSFMAGYLAAGMSKTGKVGTYGGIQIPPLVPFMTGFFNGVSYYNQVKGASVEVLGWDPLTETGLFTGNFESLDDGRLMAETLMDEGADVIFPVAGPCGLGSAAAIQERGNAIMIGVDTDMTVSAPEYTDILLTSVLKNMDIAVFDASKMVLEDKFEGGIYVGTTSNGGVGLAPYYEFEDDVPDDLKAEVDQIGEDIANGKLDPMTAEVLPVVKVCQVTDVGGIDDKTFNQTAWKGVQDAMEKLGAEGKFLESQQQTDYEKNINTFIEEDCDLIVPVGFLLGDATQKAAEANPDQTFAIVDYAYDPTIPNVLGLTFSVDQPSFMAGYLAAGMSKTGKVGTYGGIQIPPLEPFMTGFYNGVMYYNKMKSASVEVLGWDPASATGLFTGNFESLDDGRLMAETLMDEGADVIFPVAGPCGLGSAAAIQERGNAIMIGVDTDMTISAPEYTDILLTSVLKNMDKAVFDAAKTVARGLFEGGIYVGTMTNGGVGLAPYYEFDDDVPDDLKAEVEQIGSDIAKGVIDPMAEVK